MSSSSRSAAAARGEDVATQIAALRDQIDGLLQDKAGPALSSMADSAQNTAAQAYDAMRDGAANVSRCVQERPIAALAMASGLGFLLGLMVRR